MSAAAGPQRKAGVKDEREQRREQRLGYQLQRLGPHRRVGRRGRDQPVRRHVQSLQNETPGQQRQ